MDGRGEVLMGLIRKWQATLRIQDWCITLAEEQPDRDNNGDVWMKGDKMVATIAIDSRIAPEHRELIILHECLEVLTREYAALLYEAIDNDIPESMRPVYKKRADEAQHRIIYRLESALLPDNPRPFDMVKCRE